MKNVLFVNSPGCFSSYLGTRINAVVQTYPLLSHSALAAVVRNSGKRADILDLGIERNWESALTEKIQDFCPDLICMTSTTTIFPEVSRMSFYIREIAGERIKLVIGGPHATALPEECLRYSAFDFAITGEGENPLVKLISGTVHSEIPGLYYKKDGTVYSTIGSDPVKDLDSLPFFALDLYNLKRYKCSKMICRRYPLVNYITSRGCPYKCTYCNHNIFGTKIRYKSPGLVIAEIKHMLRLGVKEIRIIDDVFTFDIDRAKLICELIIRNNLKFPWTLAAGLRVDCLDAEFLKLAKKAGLYQVAFGFESGDQAALDSVNKKITIAQSLKAMEYVKQAKIESVGFFMLGLPSDTEESLQRTIDFALKLSPTYAKAALTIPFPGTELFADYQSKDLIKSREWGLYNLHSAADIYRHPHLEIETIKKYYNRFYNAFYLRPGYLMASLLRSIWQLSIIDYFAYAVQTFFPKIFKPSVRSKRHFFNSRV